MSQLLKKFRNISAISFVIMLLLAPFVVFQAFAVTPAWIQTVDSTGFVGSYSSIALDSRGNPHIAYSDTTNDDLKYASLSGSVWISEIVDKGCNASFCSLDLDANDNPHISYFDSWNSDLKYAYWNGTNWNIQIVESSGYVGGYSSLRVDSTGKPHIAYQEISPNFDLKYASPLDSGWEIQTVDSLGNVGFFASLALDQNDNPKISYVEMINGVQNNTLKFASWTGSNWIIQVVDSVGDVGRFDSLALDSNGIAHISYFDGMNGCLKYAAQSGSGWDLEVVDFEGDTGNVGSQTSIALDSDDNPHIAYVDEKDSDIKYAWYNGSGWSVQVINSASDNCRSPSLVLSSEGYPRISFYDAMYGDLKYAAVDSVSFPTPLMPPKPSPSPSPAPQPTGIQIVESAAADVGMMSSLVLDSKDYPHIAYFNLYRPENTSIKYAQWTGSNWEIQTVKGNGMVGPFPSLALDSNGSPHIVYRNGVMLEYASWTGSEWSFQPVGSGEYGGDNSLVLDSNDNPRLSYQEARNSELRYASLTSSGWALSIVDSEGTSCGSYNALALDSYGNPHICYMQSLPAVGLKYAYYNGSAWQVETVDSGGAGVGFDSSIAVDSAGRVHISYFSFIPGTFNCYLKYAVRSESGWKIVTVDAGNGTGQDTSLALDSKGNPHISYYDADKGDLRYAWWNGSVWTIRIIDSIGNVGEASSLALDSNDKAHISYYDRTNTDLKYVNVGSLSSFPEQGVQTSFNSLNPQPNPVGVGQRVFVNMSIAPLPPTTQDHFTGVTLWVTRPDGTTETLGPWIIEPNFTLYAGYTPTQVGAYTLQLNYAGQYFSSSNVTYLPTRSLTTTLTVQQEPVFNPNEPPTPNQNSTPNSSGPVLGLIRIMPDGTVQGTDKIQRNGNVYTLTDDINVELNDTFGNLKPCLLIMRDFAVVDGAGHLMQSNGTGLGIYARGVQGVTIKNFKIRGFAEGISSYTMDPVAPIEILYKKTANNQIVNNDIDVVNNGNSIFSDISGWGIFVEFSEDITVTGNTIKTMDASKGLYVGATCNRTTITNNKFIGCGMDLYSLKQKTIAGNTIDDRPVVFFDGKSNLIVEGAEQVFIVNCQNMTVRNISPNNEYRRTIQLENTRDSTVTNCRGIIVLTDCSNNSVYGNSPKNIALFRSSYNRVFENTVTVGGVIFPRATSEYYDGRRCIDLSASSYNEIYGNTLQDSNYGIRLGEIEAGSQHNNIYSNRILNVGQGVIFAYSSENAIYSNSITNCSIGISISVSENINAFKNTISQCGTAVSICGSNNRFHHNNFLENTRQASVVDQTLFSSSIIIAYSTNNAWDDGKEGNYWSNYNGTDSNGDGVGEQPYPVCEDNVDRYPLVKPVTTQTTGAATAGATQESTSTTQSRGNTTPPSEESTPIEEEPTSTDGTESKPFAPTSQPVSAGFITVASLLAIAIAILCVGPLYLLRRKR